MAAHNHPEQLVLDSLGGHIVADRRPVCKYVYGGLFAVAFYAALGGELEFPGEDGAVGGGHHRLSVLKRGMGGREDRRVSCRDGWALARMDAGGLVREPVVERRPVCGVSLCVLLCHVVRAGLVVHGGMRGVGEKRGAQFRDVVVDSDRVLLLSGGVGGQGTAWGFLLAGGHVAQHAV